MLTNDASRSVDLVLLVPLLLHFYFHFCSSFEKGSSVYRKKFFKVMAAPAIFVQQNKPWLPNNQEMGKFKFELYCLSWKTIERETGSVLVTHYFLCTSQTGPISYSVCHWQSFTAFCYVTV